MAKTVKHVPAIPKDPEPEEKFSEVTVDEVRIFLSNRTGMPDWFKEKVELLAVQKERLHKTLAMERKMPVSLARVKEEIRLFRDLLNEVKSDAEKVGMDYSESSISLAVDDNELNAIGKVFEMLNIDFLEFGKKE